MSTREILHERIDTFTDTECDKLYAVINLFFVKNESAVNIMESGTTLEESRAAFAELEKLRRPSTVDRDYKEELYEALREKYENID